MQALGHLLNRVDEMSLRRPFAGSLTEKATLALIATLPFLPRPTLEHPVRFVVPVFILVFLGVNIRRVLSSLSSIATELRVNEVIFLGGAFFVTYLGWSVVNQEYGELSRVVARGLWIAVFVSMVVWFHVSAISLDRIYRTVFYSSIALSVLVVIVGVTGISVFEAPRPGRDYGIVIPFYKNTGVPRSYGEYGILMSIAWAYWLVNFRQLTRAARLAAGTLLFAAIFIAQSRTAYLSIVVVTGAYFVDQVFAQRGAGTRKFVLTSMLIAAVLLPALLELVLSSQLGKLGFVEALVGKEVYQENVLTRFLIIGSALEALTEGGMTALLGISHANWDATFEALGQEPVALHNHFLSNLVFYGLLGGTASLIVFFVWPFIGVLRRQITLGDRTSRIALLSLFGAIVNLHFYEGFFSLILALELALLWSVSRGVMLETRMIGDDHR